MSSKEKEAEMDTLRVEIKELKYIISALKDEIEAKKKE